MFCAAQNQPAYNPWSCFTDVFHCPPFNPRLNCIRALQCIQHVLYYCYLLATVMIIANVAVFNLRVNCVYVSYCMHCVFCSTHPVTNNNGPVVNTILFNLWLNYTRVLRRVRQVSVLLRPSYRYRRSNCKYTINQPMVESRPCFMAVSPFYGTNVNMFAYAVTMIVNMTIYNLWLNCAQGLSCVHHVLYCC